MKFMRNFSMKVRQRVRALKLLVTTLPVKMRLERSAERDKRESKNNSSAKYVQSEAADISNRIF
jgi:hypothetical protein